ncbi:MAG: 2-methylaconitate cis-trans isomerase PrpF family protein [Thermoprotei archaeon]|jgi:2-methylaconitate cis-trans-isomerase PrpF
MLKAIPCVIMRGGTSKGILFKKNDLPEDETKRDEIILKIFGSGDPSQIDGLGGAQIHTSKTMIVWKSAKPNVDIEYLFGQVGIERRFIEWVGNCGNLTAAVGPFSIDEGLIKGKEPSTRVRMYNVNTNKRIDAIVPVENEKTKYDGNYQIDGVPNPGSRIDLVWYDPKGSLTNKLLPTGNPIDKITIENTIIEASLVDAGNPAVFIRAKDIGLQGSELPWEIPSTILEKLEKIRSKAAELMGLVEKAEEAIIKSPHFPHIVIIGEKKDYKTSNGKLIKKDEYTVLARLFSLQRMHHAYPVTGSISTAAASKIPGSIVNQLSEDRGEDVIIAHPKGIIDVKVKTRPLGDLIDIESITVGRTARRLMAGLAYYIEK